MTIPETQEEEARQEPLKGRIDFLFLSLRLTLAQIASNLYLGIMHIEPEIRMGLGLML